MSIALSALCLLESTNKQFWVVPFSKGKTRMFCGIIAGITYRDPKVTDVVVLFPMKALKDQDAPAYDYLKTLYSNSPVQLHLETNFEKAKALFKGQHKKRVVLLIDEADWWLCD